MSRKPKGFDKFDKLMKKLVNVPPAELDAARDDEIHRLEASLERMDGIDPEEIESGEYQVILDRLVKLREERDRK